jgi:hypothetical protein
MFDTNDAHTPSKPSRLKRILFAVIFMAIGSGITYIATGYFWSGKYDDGYRIGKIDQATEDKSKVTAQQEEADHRLAEKALNSPSN